MYLKSLEYLLRSENRSRQYLVKKSWRKKRRFCVRCRSRKIYRLADKRYRCARCQYTFHDFSGRWVGRLNLKANKWLWVLKLFDLEIPARQIAEEIGLSYPTALKAIHLIRCAIAQQVHGENQVVDKCHMDEFHYLCRRIVKNQQGLGDKTFVFGLLEHSGKVEVTVVRDVTAQALLDSEIKFVKRGSIFCTDRFRHYDALLFSGPCHLTAKQAKNLANGKIDIERLEGFWGFAERRLSRAHVVSKATLPLYLKELEFRYNHRYDDLFELLANSIARLMPNPL